MVWEKSANKHIADWRFFSLEDGSFGRLAVISLVIGLVWGIGVVKLHGLPGDEARKMTRSVQQGAAEGKDLHDQMCRDFPKSRACQPNKGGGDFDKIK